MTYRATLPDGREVTTESPVPLTTLVVAMEGSTMRAHAWYGTVLEALDAIADLRRLNDLAGVDAWTFADAEAVP